MGWAEPEWKRGEIDRAGKRFVDPATGDSDREVARAMINNWRSSHGFPLNTVQTNLRKRARSIDAEAIVAQSIKRLPSIRSKLQRFSHMDLSRMQDLGGCRAIMTDIHQVAQLVERYDDGYGKHTLVKKYDYLWANPKPSGYRGVHLVYRYYSDKKSTYNGLSIELQLRTALQHAWATAVETVDAFTQQALKSSRGGVEWLRFFTLMSGEIVAIEQTAPVPEVLSDASERRAELRDLASTLDVIARLESYSNTVRLTAETATRDRYFLLELAENGQLVVRSFRTAAEGALVYDTLEGTSNDDVVLVAVDSLAALPKAYPNYYLDTVVFTQLVRDAIQVRRGKLKR